MSMGETAPLVLDLFISGDIVLSNTSRNAMLLAGLPRFV